MQDHGVLCRCGVRSAQPMSFYVAPWHHQQWSMRRNFRMLLHCCVGQQEPTDSVGPNEGQAAPGVAGRAESESSWGELQAGNVVETQEGSEGLGSGPEQLQDTGSTASHESGRRSGILAAGGRRPASGSVYQAVGGDGVMVSPVDNASEDGNGDAMGAQGVAFDGAVGGEGGPNLRGLMTMLVVSIRMQRLVHWVVRRRCLDGLSEENLVGLLGALEVSVPWHGSMEARRKLFSAMQRCACIHYPHNKGASSQSGSAP